MGSVLYNKTVFIGGIPQPLKAGLSVNFFYNFQRTRNIFCTVKAHLENGWRLI